MNEEVKRVVIWDEDKIQALKGYLEREKCAVKEIIEDYLELEEEDVKQSLEFAARMGLEEGFFQ
ncbi:MAG: hypothetical protein QXJ68_08565 [Methanocellales archaeon]